VHSFVGIFVCCFAIHAQEPNKKADPKPGVEPVFPAKIDVIAEKPDKDGKQRIIVDLRLEKDFYAYANPPGIEDILPAQTTMTVTGKTPPRKVEITYPKGEARKIDSVATLYVYTNKVRIEAVVERAVGDVEPLLVTVTVQPFNWLKGVCNWFPTQLKKSVQ
jgi:hypothetical protein